MRPRVLVLNHFAGTRRSAGGTRHIELFGRLSGWDPVIVAARYNTPGGGPVEAEGIVRTVPVVRPGAGAVRRISSWVSYTVTAFWAGLRAGRLDVVYASTPHLLAPLAAWALARLRRARLILEIRDVWPKVLVDMGATTEDSIAYRVFRRLELFHYSRADGFVVLAEGVRDYLVDLGLRPELITFIPNGADPGQFDDSSDRDELRANYGFTRTTAVYAGAHGTANGLDLLLDAGASLRSTAPDLEIVLVGTGVEKKRLVERARTEGLTNIRFLDPIPKAEVPQLLLAADIGIHCLADVPLFRTGVSPNKLFDYMAAGLPVITNTPGEVSDFIISASGGVVTEPHRLGDGLATLASMTDAQRRCAGQSGKQFLAAYRSYDVLADRLGEVLARTARGSLPPP